MTWTRFGYICRRALLDVEKGAPIEASLTRAEAEEGSQLYGKPPSGGSVPRSLLERMGSLSREEAISALRVYGQVGIVDQLDEPLQFKRVIAYLCLVVFVFHGVGAVYLLKVIPVFADLMDHIGGQLPARLEYFQAYWLAQTGVVSTLLLLCLLAAFQVRRLFRFRNNAGRGLLGRVFLGPGVRRSYRRVNSVLCYPADARGGDSQDPVTVHLDRARSAGMDMYTEVRELLQLEVRELLRRSERQLKIMAAAVALVVVLAMALFLSSAYAPIFIMGEMI